MKPFINLIIIPESNSENRCGKFKNIYFDSHYLSTTVKSLLSSGLDNEKVKGKKVLIKPNWVIHSVYKDDDFCLRTHDNFLKAALRNILEMGPSEVLIGDAPIQGADWTKIISKTFLEEVSKLSEEFRIPVQIMDFRRRIYNTKDHKPSATNRTISDNLIFDLGKESFLEPITIPGKTTFRVTDYNPDQISAVHSQGVHKYCIVKEFFESDIILSLPKIKTHQKTCITGALKNIVGINGEKGYLPHHRIGGTEKGGDCYPGGSLLRYWSELTLDEANRRQGEKIFWFWQKLSSLLWIISFPGPEHQISAGWYGNDTTWRMVMDLNRIALFGNEDGKISDKPQRQIFSLCDGIIAGQGDGPLNPIPLPLGVISFANNSYLNDYALALLMNLAVDKIPLLNNPVINSISDYDMTLNGIKILPEELKNYSVNTILPKGWRCYQDRTI